MPVCKTFFKIAIKRVPSILMYFIIFAVITILMTHNGPTSINSSFESKSLDISIIDHDNSKASKALTDYLDEKHDILDIEDTKESIQDNLYYQYISYVLIIPEGYEDNLKKGNTENILTNKKIPGSGNGQFVDNQIDEYLATLNMYLVADYDLDKALSATIDSFEKAPEVKTTTFEKGETIDNTLTYYFFSYLPYVFLAMLISGMAPIIIILNKEEINNRTYCSSITVTNKNLQIALGCFVYCFITWAIYMAIGFITCGKSMLTTYGLQGMLNSAVFMLIAVSITILVSNFVSGKNADNIVNMISNIVSLGMCFLCGVFVPQWMLADSIVNVSKFLPAYWYIYINDMTSHMSKVDYSLGRYVKCIGIELGFALLFFIISLVASKYIKESKK